MKRITKMTRDEKNLYKRYLLWCYKTTRESLERIDRKFTQLDIDKFVYDDICKCPELRDKSKEKKYQGKLVEFKQYITHKEKSAYVEKFERGKIPELKADYWYWDKRLKAIKKAVRHFLGARALTQIERAYEEEMERRILAAREHS